MNQRVTPAMTQIAVKMTVIRVVLAITVFGLGACAPTLQTVQNDPVNTVQENRPTPELPVIYLSEELLGNLLIAELSFFRNDVHTSIEVLEEVAFETRDPRIAEISSLRALNQQRFDVAANTTDLWVELSPENFAAWLSRGEVKALTEDYKEAAGDFIMALELTPDLSATIEHIADLVINRVPQETGFDLFSSVMSKFPNNQAGRLMLANLAAAAGKGNSEIDLLLDRAEKIADDQDLMARARFIIYMYTERSQEALSFAESFLLRTPKSSLLRDAYADYLSENGFYIPAVGQFERLEGASARFSLGVLHQRANHLDLALESFFAYNKLRPRDQSAYIQIAEILLQQTQYEDAKEWISQITQSRYLFERTLLSAQYIAETESVEQAVASLKEYKPANDQQKIGIYLEIDDIYRDADELEKAVQVLDEALEIYPGNITLLLAHSFTASELNLIELAEEYINIVLQEQPNNYVALNALGYTLADQTDRFEEALELIGRALEVKPRDPYILDSMGWVQYKLGNFDSAIEFLKTALEQRDDPTMSAHLGEVYWATGKKQKARRIWNAAIEKTPDSKILIDTIDKFIN